METKYVVDTHPLIWYFIGKKTITTKAKELIGSGLNRKLQLVIPTMVILEAYQVSLKKVGFIFPEFIKVIEKSGSLISPFDEKILRRCYKLPKEINIHDKVIIATAQVLGCKIITKDKVIRKNYKDLVVW